MRRWLKQRFGSVPSRTLLLVLLVAGLLPGTRLLFLVWKEAEFFPALPRVQLPLSASHWLPANQLAPIAKVIHQSWKAKNLPMRFRAWAASWKQCFPKWEYRLWTDADNEKFVRSKFPEFYPVWASLPTKIEQVDSVRYLYLYTYGGLYADLDCECLRPFEHLLSNCSLLLASMNVGSGWTAARMPSGLVQNSFMYSRPGHDFWMEAVAEVTRIAKRKWLNSWIGSHPIAEDRTGPLLLMRLLAQRWKAYKDSICVYPPEYFNPFSWYEETKDCQTLNRMTAEQMQRCRRRYNGSYVLQYHTQVWRKGSSNMGDLG